MYVTARSVELKSSTAFFADILGTLSYGDQVTILKEYGKWVEVRSVESPILSGWIVSSVLTAKRILTSPGNATTASADELALAGKGFNEEVENAYRQNGTLNYDAIDDMETEQIPGKDLFNFLLEGHLNRGE
jgi:hypothetical protein